MSGSENYVPSIALSKQDPFVLSPKLEPFVLTPVDTNSSGSGGVGAGNKRRRDSGKQQQNAANVRVQADDHYNDRISEEDRQFFDSLPPGYRFCPTDDELIDHYLFKKLKNVQLPRNQIREVNIYRFNPDEIAERYPSINKNAWYFFTPRDKKYLNGTRPNRAAGDGFWKACGADKVIRDKLTQTVMIGLKKALVYHRGKPPKGQKTNWLMHEFMLHEKHPQLSEIKINTNRSENCMKLNDFVLCKIYKRNDSAQRAENAEVSGDQEVKEEFDPSAVKEEFERDGVAEAAAKEEGDGDGDNNAAFHYLQPLSGYQPYNSSSIQFASQQDYYYNQFVSAQFHQNQLQHYGYESYDHSSDSGLNPNAYMNSSFTAYEPSMDEMNFLVEDEFDDIITPSS